MGVETKMETETVTVKVLPANSLSKEDTKRWIVNILRFALNSLAIYLGYISTNVDKDGFTWMIFVPNAYIMGVITKDFTNSLQDLITKYTSEKKYINGEKV